MLAFSFVDFWALWAIVVCSDSCIYLCLFWLFHSYSFVGYLLILAALLSASPFVVLLSFHIEDNVMIKCGGVWVWWLIAYFWLRSFSACLVSQIHFKFLLVSFSAFSVYFSIFYICFADYCCPLMDIHYELHFWMSFLFLWSCIASLQPCFSSASIIAFMVRWTRIFIFSSGLAGRIECMYAFELFGPYPFMIWL